MKVIDLLNKIANNEEVPEKIYYKGNVYYQVGSTEYNNQCYENCEIDTDEWKFLCAIENLNDDLGLIQDNEINKDNEIEKMTDPYFDYPNSTLYDRIRNKINEIIDVINEMKEGK